MSDPRTVAHPDVDRLSDLEAGLMTGPGEAAVAAHVAGCVACSDLVGMLGETRAMLTALPAVPMPTDVAARIDAALAGAAGSPPQPEAVGSVTVLADHADHHRRSAPSRSRWRINPGAVAAGVALLFVAAIGIGAVQQHRGGGAARTSGAAAAPAAAVPGTAAQVSGRHYTVGTLDAGVRSLLATTGAPALTSGTGVTSKSQSQDRAATPTVPAAAPPPELGRLLEAAALRACVTELAGNPRINALAVDIATFDGKPAAVVVLADKDPTKVDAWVVGPNCGPGSADLLRFQVVPRTG